MNSFNPRSAFLPVKRSVIFLCVLWFSTGTMPAPNLVWDDSQPTDIWDFSTTNWLNGVTPSLWSDGSNAFFTDALLDITVTQSVAANQLNLSNNTSLTLRGAAPLGVSLNSLTFGTGAILKVKDALDLFMNAPGAFSSGTVRLYNGARISGVDGAFGANVVFDNSEGGTGGSIYLANNNLTFSSITSVGVGAGLIENGGTLDASFTVNTTTTNEFSGGIFDGGEGGLLRFVKAGSGTVILSGFNSYSLGTDLVGGTLEVANNSALGSGTLAIKGSGTTLRLADTVTLSNAVQLEENATFEVTNGADVSSVTSLISEMGGSFGFTKTGAGTLLVGGPQPSTYTGTTILSSGKLLVSEVNPLGTGLLQLNGGTTFGNSAGASLPNPISFVGLPNINFQANAPLFLSGDVSLNDAVRTINFTEIFSDVEFAGAITSAVASSGGLNFQTTATDAVVFFSGTSANTYTGLTTVGNNVALVLKKTDAIAITGDLNIESGGLVEIDVPTTPGTPQISTTSNVTVNGSLFYYSDSGSQSVNNLNGSGLIANEGFEGFGSLTFTVLGEGTFSGTFQDGIGKPITLVKSDLGTLILSGAKTHQGGTQIISGGTLQVSSDTSLGNTTGGLLLDDGTLNTTASLASSRTINLGAGGGTFDVGNGTILSLNGSISGSGGLTKVGLGALDLTANAGTVDYTGATTLGGGLLRISADNQLGTSPGGVVFNGGTLESTATFSSIRPTTLTGNGIFKVLSATQLDWDGAVSGNGPLTKIDLGVLKLGGTNTYAGGTRLNGGTISVSANENLGASTGGLIFNGGTLLTTLDMTMNRATTLNGSGGVFSVDGGATLTQQGVISGSGPLTKSGVGTLALSGANTYTGGTSIDGGTLRLENNAALGTGNLTIQGSTIDYADGVNIATPIFLEANGVLNVSVGSAEQSGAIAEDAAAPNYAVIKTGSGTLVLSNSGNNYMGGTDIQGGTLSISADAQLGDLSGGVLVDGGTLLATSSFSSDRLFDVGSESSSVISVTSGNILTLTNSISGGSDLIKQGAGVLFLSGNNSHTLTNLQAGTLRVGSNTALGTTDLFVGGGQLAYEDGIDLLTDILLANNLSVRVDTGATAAQTGTISEVSTLPFALTKVGAGTLNLIGTNTYQGGTILNQGTIAITADENLGNTNGGLTFNGGTLSINGSFSPNRATLLQAGGGVIGVQPGHFVNWLGVISGSGSLTKAGLGTLTLSNTNTHTGGTTLSGGTLSVSSDANLGDASGSLTFQGGTLRATTGFAMNRVTTLGAGGGTFDLPSGVDLTQNGTISGSGTLTKDLAGKLILNGPNSYSGGTVLQGGALELGNDTALGTGTLAVLSGSLLYNGGITVANSITLQNKLSVGIAGGVAEHSGVITDGAATWGITKTGAGRLILSGINSYEGTEIQNGTLSISNDGNLGNSSGMLGIGGGTLHTTADLLTSRSTNIGNAGGTLQVGNGTTLTHAGTITGDGTLTKTGLGTLRLQGSVNPLTLLVNQGTLETGPTANVFGKAGSAGLDGQIAVTISSGASLANAGLIEGGAGGDSSGTGGLGGIGVDFQATDLSNNGTIRGGAGGNSSLADGGAGGTGLSHFGGTFVNLSTIEGGRGGDGVTGAGEGGYGVAFSSAADFTNLGTVRGGAGGDVIATGPAGGVGGIAIFLGAGGTFSNQGTVIGGSAGVDAGGTAGLVGTAVLISSGTGTFINQGSITGDVIMGNFVNNATLSTGSTIAGDLNLNTRGASTLTLSGTGTGRYSTAVTGTTIFSGALSKTGTGTWILDQALTQTSTSLNRGTLRIENAAGLGSGGLSVLNASTLDYADGVDVTTAIELQDNLTMNVDQGGGSPSFRATQSGVISENGGSFGIAKSGGGELLLTAANSYSGGTTLLDNGGILILDSAASLGSGPVNLGLQTEVRFINNSSAGGNTYTVGNGAQLNFLDNSNGTSATGVNLDGNLSLLNIRSLASGNLSIGTFSGTSSTAQVDLGANTFTFGSSNLDSSFAGSIVGGDSTTPVGKVVKSGSGLTVFSGASAYYGGTDVNGGTLRGTVTDAFGFGDIVVNSGGALEFASSGVSAANLAIQNSAGTVTFFGGATAGSSTIQNTGDLIFRGTSDAATSTITNNSGGSLFLEGTSSADSASVINLSGGVVDISGLIAPDAGIGALSGAGNLFLGSKQLVLGALGTDGTISGAIQDGGVSGGIGGSLEKVGAGTLTLSGTTLYTGATRVSSGKLLVHGTLANSDVGVSGGATLGGTGTIENNVTLADAAILSPGASIGTLSIGGNLDLNGTSRLDYELGTLGTGDFVNLGGNLRLDGVLDLTDAGGFGAGTYTLLSYGGSLVNNGLVLGTLPTGVSPGQLDIKTGSGNVDLLVAAESIQYWDGGGLTDGAINGGDGVWNNTNTNWASESGLLNASWGQGTAIFGGTPGTVTLAENVIFKNLTFDTDGYTITGAFDLSTSSASVLAVNSGVATIESNIVGSGSIKKNGPGVLVLSGSNGFVGGSTLSEGTIRVLNDQALGSSTLSVTGTGTTLAYAAGVQINNSLNLGENLTLNVGSGFAAQSGDLHGTGGIRKAGAGSLQLDGLGSTFSGGVQLSGGMLELASNSALGTGGLQVTGTGTTLSYGDGLDIANTILLGNNLTLSSDGSATQSGAISGVFGITKVGTGTLTLGSSSYTGTTRVQEGTLGAVVGGFTSGTDYIVDGGNLLLDGQVLSVASLTGAGGEVSLGAEGVLYITNSGAQTFAGSFTGGANSLVGLDGGGTYRMTGSSNSAGALELTNGGTLISSGASSRFGELSISGVLNVPSGSTRADYVFVGVSGDGSLRVSNGASFGSTTSDIYLGYNAGFQGTAAVNGAGTVLNASRFAVAVDGDGDLTLSDGGTLNITNALELSSGLGSGIANIGASAGQTARLPGFLTASSVTSSGPGQLQFNHSAASYIFNTPINGATAVLHTSGNTTFAATSAYTGETQILGGTVETTAGKAFGTGNLLVDGAGSSLTIRSALANPTTLANGASLTIQGGEISVASGTALTVKNGTLNSNGTLQTGDGIALELQTADAKFSNTSDLIADSGTGLVFQNGGALTNNLGSTIYGGDTGAKFLAGNGDVSNDGTIESANVALQFAAKGRVSNTGEILSTSGGTAIRSGAGAFELFNSGNIGGSIDAIEAPRSLIQNQGSIGGDLLLGNGANTVRLATGAEIQGNLSTGTNSASELFLQGSGSQLLSNAVTGTVTHAGSIVKTGSGTWILDSALPTPLGTSLNNGTLQIGNGGSTGALTGNVANEGTLAFNRSDSYNFDGIISGTGGLNQIGTGRTVLTAENTYTGTTNVSAGELRILGSLGNTNVLVGNGARLSGTGSITGIVTVENGGTFMPGTSPGVMQVGELLLNPTSQLDFELPGDRIDVVSNLKGSGSSGNLVLDGVLNLTTLSGIGNYDLLTYQGTFTNNGLELGSIPAGFNPGQFDVIVTTTGKIEFVVTAKSEQYWNGPNTTATGSITGGDGTWNNTRTNWTSVSGTLNSAWGGGMAFFQGSAGTVTLGDDIAFEGLEFGVPGYSIVGAGNRLIPTGEAVITGANATIDAALTGTGGIVKNGPGTLTLSQTSDYTGNTTVNSGTLIAAADDAFGSGIVITDNNATTEINSGVTVKNSFQPEDGGRIRNLGSINSGASIAINNLINGARVENRGLIRSTNQAIRSSGGSFTLLNRGEIRGDVLLSDSANTVRLFIGSSIVGDLDLGSAAASTLFLDGSGSQFMSTALSGNLSLTGDLIKQGSGRWIVDNDVVLNGGIVRLEAGDLEIGDGTIGSLNADIENNAALEFSRSDTFTYSGILSGTGELVQSGPGTLILDGVSNFSGTTVVRSGTLAVENDLGNTSVAVKSGAQLQGWGTILGSVNVEDGAILFGEADKTLTVGGLSLDTTTRLNVVAGAPSTTPFFQVNGDLHLDGFLNVLDGGGFTFGDYRLINYTDALEDLGLTIESLPTGFNPGDWAIDTSADGKVDLIVADGPGDQFWDGSNTAPDGAVAGGDGTWDNATTNWTNEAGTINAPWVGETAVFSGAPGLVTLGDDISFEAMRFLTGGYEITGSGFKLLPAGTAEIQTDATTTLRAAISGGGGILKTGSGTLTLAGMNDYTGGTLISQGTLELVDGGDLVGDIQNNSSLVFNRSGANLFAGDISGSGRITKNGSDDLALTGTWSTSKAVLLNDGSLSIGDGGTTGEIQSDIANNATLRLNRSNDLDISSHISGNGSLVKLGGGRAILRGAQTYTGTTAVNEGVLDIRGSLESSSTTVASGASLTGTGTLTGSATILDGGQLQGAAGSTLTTGALTLNPTSELNVALGAPSNVPLFQVNGDLQLDGLLAVTDAGGFDFGDYRLINYSGSLNDLGLTIESVPTGFNPGDWAIDTSADGKVDLIVADGPGDQYWDGGNITPDGAVAGGDGTWDNSTTNWTNEAGTINAPWVGETAIFSGTPGLVTLGDDISFEAMRFLTGGYEITGAGFKLLPVGTAEIQTDATTTLRAAISGGGGVLKTGSGTLTLAGMNDYTGGTFISQGTLELVDGGNLTGDIQNDSSLVFNRSGTNLFAGDISGSGRITKNGSDDLALTGTWSTSKAVLLNNGSLSIGDGGTTGEIQSDIVNNATLKLNRSNDLDISSQISGTGSLVKLGGGRAILRGSQTYTGTTAVNEGVLDIRGSLESSSTTVASGAALTGTGTLKGSATILDGGQLQGAAGSTLTTGALTLNSTSELNVALGAPSNVPLFQVNGDLQLDGLLAVTDAGGFDFGEYRLIDYSGSLNDLGLTIESVPSGFNPGDWAINTATNGAVDLVVVAGPGVQYWDGAATSPDSTVNGGDGIWDNTRTNWSNKEGTVHAPWVGQVAVFGGNKGLVTLGDDIRFTGLRFNTADYEIAGGEFSLQPVGRSFITTNTNAKISAPIIGSGGVTKNGGATLVLTGDNTYTGGTTISEGILQLGEGGRSGSLAGNIVNNATLAINKSNTTTLRGAISGSGDLLQDGTGNTILLGENTYTGTTFVNRGGLTLGSRSNNGTLAGDVIVQDGAYFAGSGTVAGSFDSAGLIAPGFSPGSLEVKGKFTLRSTAILEIEFASRKNFDKIQVGGVAKLNGTLSLTFTDGFRPKVGDEFSFLTAERITGRFARMIQSENSRFRLEFAGNRIGNTTIIAVWGPKPPQPPIPNDQPYREFALTTDEFRVASALDILRAQDLDTNSDFDKNIRPVLDSLDQPQLITAFNAILPFETAAFSSTFFARSKVWLPQMATRLADIRAGSRGFVASGFEEQAAADMPGVLMPVADNPWGVWVDGGGAFSTVSGFEGLGSGDANAATGTVGADYRFSENITAGFYTGYAGTWTEFGNGSQVDSNGGRLGLYSTYSNGGFYLNVVAGAELNTYDWKRRINFPGVDRTASADPNGQVFETLFGGGYDWKFGNFEAGFFAHMEYAYLNINSFTETGAGSLNLRMNDQSAESFRTNVGGQFAWNIPFGERRFRPSLRAAWRHEYLDGSRSVTSALVGGAGPSFKTVLPGDDRTDSLLLNAGFSLDLTDRLQGYVYYTGDFAVDNSDPIQSFNTGLRFEF